MSRPSLGQGIFVAFAFACAASVIAGALMPLIGAGAAFKLLVPGISLSYVIYLLKSAGSRTGNVTTLTLWSAMAFAAWWIAPPLPYYVLLHVGGIWLIRALCFCTGPGTALIDLGLSALAACAFAWTATRTGSVFLATWFFFLVQAFFVALPAWPGASRAKEPFSGGDSFARARRQADEALRMLARRP